MTSSKGSLHVLAIALSFCVAGTTFSAAQTPELAAEKRTRIESAVAKFMATTHVPGVSVAVVENGQSEWAAGFGLADVENNSPASEHRWGGPNAVPKPGPAW